MTDVRPEEKRDHPAVERVVADAFAASEFGHQGEAELVGKLREVEGALSLVAEEGGCLRGHILFTPATIESEAGTTRGLALAPMAVEPDLQSRGMGSALVEAGLVRAKASGAAFVVVFGHADYYPRFGFTPARDVEVRHGFVGLPAEPFFVLLLEGGARLRIFGGTARYHAAFGDQS